MSYIDMGHLFYRVFAFKTVLFFLGLSHLLGATSTLADRIDIRKLSRCAATLELLAEDSLPALRKMQMRSPTEVAQLSDSTFYTIFKLIENILISPDISFRFKRAMFKLTADELKRRPSLKPAAQDREFRAAMSSQFSKEIRTTMLELIYSFVAEQSAKSPLELDPLFLHQHLLPDFFRWYEKFDVINAQSAVFQDFEKKWQSTERPGIDPDWSEIQKLFDTGTATSGKAYQGVDSKIRDQILALLGQWHIFGDTITNLKIATVFYSDQVYRRKLLDIFKRLNLVNHPYMREVLEIDPDWIRFFQTGADINEERREKLKARNRVQNRLENDRINASADQNANAAKARLYEQDIAAMQPEMALAYYPPPTPLITSAVRFLILRLLDDPKTISFVPLRPSKDGDLILACKDYQLRIRFDSGVPASEVPTIKGITFALMDSSSMLHKIYTKPDSKGESTTPAPPRPNTETSDLTATKNEVHREAGEIYLERDEKADAPSIPELVFTPLQIETLQLPALAESQFHSLNQKYPGHHIFLEAAANLITAEGDLVGELAWYFGQIRKRLLADESDEERLNRLVDDTVKFISYHQAAARLAQEERPRAAVDLDSLELQDFIDGSKPVSELSSDKIYRSLRLSTNDIISVKFSDAVIEYLKSPNVESRAWLRAIRRGYVGDSGSNGWKRRTERDLSVIDYLKVLTRGRHIRIEIVRENNVYHLTRIFED